MDKTKIMLSFVSGALLLLSGCGSDSSGTGGTAPVAKATAFYVDSAIEGVTVKCGATSSVTASDGAFTYEAGAECQFKVGSVLLRTEGGLTEGKIVFEKDVPTAQFLQTLDIDGNPENGIKIPAESATVLNNMGIDTVPQSYDVLAELNERMDDANIGYHGRPVTYEDAKVHMERSYEKYFSQPLYPDTPNTPDAPHAPDVPNTPEIPQL
jgi:hypothetical protein